MRRELQPIEIPVGEEKAAEEPEHLRHDPLAAARRLEELKADLQPVRVEDRPEIADLTQHPAVLGVDDEEDAIVLGPESGLLEFLSERGLRPHAGRNVFAPALDVGPGLVQGVHVGYSNRAQEETVALDHLGSKTNRSFDAASIFSRLNSKGKY
ncbi:MAG TPA: hypothetical protein VNW71_20840 [Thermoanaerobaculia bacterium]|nr:hypothetical protein [Thermoanaerobaculia bacterium]